jgi:hypothetical protein
LGKRKRSASASYAIVVGAGAVDAALQDVELVLWVHFDHEAAHLRVGEALLDVDVGVEEMAAAAEACRVRGLVKLRKGRVRGEGEQRVVGKRL